jgi:hypothetical protein
VIAYFEFHKKTEFTPNMKDSVSDRNIRSFLCTHTVCGIHKISYAVYTEDNFLGRDAGERRYS